MWAARRRPGTAVAESVYRKARDPDRGDGHGRDLQGRSEPVVIQLVTQTQKEPVQDSLHRLSPGTSASGWRDLNPRPLRPELSAGGPSMDIGLLNQPWRAFEVQPQSLRLLYFRAVQLRPLGGRWLGCCGW